MSTPLTELTNKYLNNPYLQQKNPYIRQSRGLTPSQRELRQYVEQEKQTQDKQLDWWQPIEFIFDLLSRGQYVAANLGEDLGRMASGEQNVDALKGIKEGLTGERKGTWKKTFFGGTDVGEDEKKAYAGWFTDTPEWMSAEAKIPVIGPTSFQDVIGFLGDVFLDPINLISFGSTEAAKAAASKIYVPKVVVQTVKQAGNLDIIKKFASKTFDVDFFAKLLDKGKKGSQKALTEATEYLGKHAAKKDIARFLNKVTKEAYKEGLRLTPGAVQKNFTKNLITDQARYIDDTSKALVKQGKKQAKQTLEAMQKSGEFSGLDELISIVSKKKVSQGQLETVYKGILEAGKEGGAGAIEGIPKKIAGRLENLDRYIKELKETQSPEFLKQFAGMGERSMSFMGGEFFKGVRQPNIVSRTFSSFVDSIKETKVGGTLSNALWDMTNTGPVGKLRQMFGFRNPYQKMLHVKQLEVTHLGKANVERRLNELADWTAQYSDDILKKSKSILAQAEDMKIDNINDILSKPAILDKLGVNEKELGEIKKYIGEHITFTDQLHFTERELQKEGLFPEKMGYLKFYLPHVTQNKIASQVKGGMTVRGSFSPGFSKTRKMSLLQRESGEIERFKLLLGVDDVDAAYMVNELNWSTTNMDIKEMLMHRVIAHEQVMTHANLVREFKEFGISFGGNAPQAAMSATDFFGDVNPGDAQRNQALFSFLKTQGNEIPELGIRQINHPALKGMYFDKDVAGIIDKVVSITGSDEGLNWFLQKSGAFTAWWKGMATSYPGFPIRNHISNRFTAFMKDGVRSLNPKRNIEALTGTIHGLYGDDFLKKFKLGDDFSKKRLRTYIAGKPISEWAEKAKEWGIITKSTYAFDKEDLVKQFAQGKEGLSKKLNLFSNKNVVFEKSREINAIVESYSKFESFLNDLESMAKSTTDGVATDAMISEAAMNTKKFFFDYEDLTEFEQKVMKNIIPFYTWLRKNIALQTTQMIENRQMYSMIAKGMRDIQPEGTDSKDLPEYMREQGYIPTEKTGEDTVKTWWPNLPYADLNKLPFRFEVNDQGIPLPVWTPEEVVQEFLSSANPLLKTFAEVFGSEKGFDMFRKRDLDSQAVAPRVFRLFAANPQILGFIDSLIKGAGYKDGLEAGKDSQGRLVIDAKIQKILENNFVVLERIDQSWDSLTTIIPQLEDAAVKMTGYENKYEGVNKLLRTISFLFGIKERELDLEQEKLYRYREVLKKAEEEKSKAAKKKPGREQRSKKYLLNEKKRMRRMGLY